jgi:hypothetical protein
LNSLFFLKTILAPCFSSPLENKLCKLHHNVSRLGRSGVSNATAGSFAHNIAANRCWRLARREAQRKPPTAVITATRWRQARSEAERLTPTPAILRCGNPHLSLMLPWRKMAVEQSRFAAV